MNILLTGATGFLGRNLLTRLIASGHNVNILVRTISPLNIIESSLDKVKVHVIEDTRFEDMFLNYRIDTIIHCATNYGRGELNLCDLLDANLIMPLRLLQEGSKAGVRSFINTDTILDKYVNEYALSKSQFQEWLKTYSKKMLCVNMVLEHFYGPYGNQKNFVSYVVNQLLNKVDHLNLTMGEQKRDFIYIDDVVSAFLLILDKCLMLKSGYLNYEIGTGISISIRDFVDLVKQLTGNTSTNLNYGVIPYRENEVMLTDLNIDAISALGWNPNYKLKEGLTRMIEQERESQEI